MTNTGYIVVPGIGFFILLFGWLAFHVQATVKKRRRGINLKFDIEISPEEIRDQATISVRIDDRILKFQVPKEASSGTRILVGGEGRSKRQGWDQGDLYLYVQVKEGLITNPSELRPVTPHVPDQFDCAAEELKNFLVGKFGQMAMDALERRRQTLVLGVDQESSVTYFLSGNGLKRSVKRQDGSQGQPEAISCETAVRALVRSRSIAPQDCVRWIRSQVPLF